MTITPEIQQKVGGSGVGTGGNGGKAAGPFHVLAGEALDVVRFCQRYWEPAQDHTGQVIRPGLESAKRNGTFNANIATDLLELREMLQAAQTRYQLLVSTPAAAPIERAQFVLSELRATLEWYFDDNVTDERDAQLERWIESHDGASSHDAVAAALFDFAALAENHRDASWPASRKGCGKPPRPRFLEIDLKGLRAAGFEIPPVTRVTSAFGMPGGGYEMKFPYQIPPEYLRVIQQ